MNNNIVTILRDYQVENRTYAEMHEELYAMVYNEEYVGVKLEPHIAMLGLHFTGNSNDPEDSIYSPKVFTRCDETFVEMLASNSVGMWREVEYYALLVCFFGEKLAPWVQKLLDRVDEYILGGQYDIKEATWHNAEHTFLKQCNVISGLLYGISFYDNHNYDSYSIELPLHKQVEYSMHLSLPNYLPYVWAVALDSGEGQLIEVVDTICDGDNEHGRWTPSFLLMLMASKQSKYWEKVKDILVNAGREEGIRQDITRLLSHVQVANLKYFLEVILSHNLVRYEAVRTELAYHFRSHVEDDKQDNVKRLCELMLYAINHYDYFDEKELSTFNEKEFYALMHCYLWIHREMAFGFVESAFEEVERKFQLVILEFLPNFNEYTVESVLFNKILESRDQEFIAMLLNRINQYLEGSRASRYFIRQENYEDIYQVFYDLYEQYKSGKTLILKSSVIPDYYRSFELNKEELLTSLLYLTEESSEKARLFIDKRNTFTVDFKEELLNVLLFGGKEYGLQGYGYSFKGEIQPTYEVQNELAFAYLKERKETIAFGCMRFLTIATLSSRDEEEIVAYFKGKFKKTQQHFIRLLISRQDDFKDRLLEQLILSEDVNQRLTAMEGLVVLAQRDEIHHQLGIWLAQLDELGIQYAKEEEEYLVLLRDFGRQGKEGQDTDMALYDATVVSAVVLPSVEENTLFSQRIAHNWGLSKKWEEVVRELDSLEHLMKQYAMYEYEHFNYGKAEKVLLGTHFTKMHSYSGDDEWTAEQHFQDYPLYEVWNQWFMDSKLDALDLFLLRCATSETEVPELIKPLLDGKLPYFYNELSAKYDNYWYAMGTVFSCLTYQYPFKEKTTYCLDGLKTIYNSITQEVLDLEIRTSVYGEEYSYTWVDYTDLSWYAEFIPIEDLTEEQCLAYFRLLRWRQLNCNKVDDSYYLLPFELMAIAYDKNEITRDEFIQYLVVIDNRKSYFSSMLSPFTKRFINDKVQQVLVEFKAYYLQQVMDRDNPTTKVFDIVFDFQEIEGMQYFFGLLHKIKHTGISKESIYYYAEMQITIKELGQIYSKLIRRTTPLSTDSQEMFNAQVAEINFSAIQWIEVAVACPQWIKYITTYLDWQGLESAIWWLFAHLLDNEQEEERNKIQKQIQRYSAIALEEFEGGVVDIDWFFSFYHVLGEERWQMLYDSTKFMAVEGHTRVKLYADVLLGKVSMKDLKTRVISKRDRNYVRACGLFPLSETDREGDLMDRYELLEQFKKGSKKYGAMRQENDLKIYNVAMQNIARAAGYTDAVRFQWSMESVQVQSILENYKELVLDEYTFSLTVSDEGKVELTVKSKGDKPLKAIPAKLKKNEQIIDLVERQKALKEQYSRSRLNLEQAMLRQDAFSYAEMQKLLLHPIIKHHLAKLVFKCGEVYGLFVEGVFTTIDGVVMDVQGEEEFVIVHCYGLYQSGQWVNIQAYLFDKQIEQPFKQVFRELYLHNEAEETNIGSSNRYTGYQVKDKQTLGLFKTRNWQYEYYANYSKLYFEEDIRVEVYIDYLGGSNAEYGDYVSLEHVLFTKASSDDVIALTEVNPIVFSEVMRDLDLVVSVAYVGGVDPETSLSTVQMRMAVVRETARLLKLTNIEYKERHLVITGTKGIYSLHVGSGVIHLISGTHLYIEPVHTQDRGKLFLPFVDDDPKTTEIVSKALILARDGSIRDTGILRQIE
ncbi:DUF4132 domain-containing protein [Myroides odoratimimus]|uniref:DUF4132 domain-containing protein n=1 Tax=Myroides odoratimimus CCUG 10230 TaxID=883150 RepID=A0ABN0EA29_9FLAO|nr:MULTISPECIES: DUF4132 domain-containing protein [Myroides]EHO09430.1 hypothetical protein HMPREF9712_01739 [Myroides odoratimimus CCUG 10230]MCS7472368.1 DUF4132 domain-containing protein [Myroides odoratimimus]MDM1084926.1 DUF4132 domain-containing protein [Myroides odoratimimus]MDM1457760.1 DUF4132 domain-containing protein [Myroides odoratimimus]MDM1508974.1 DUF4132 domain-containing protein [Myroides odoratimimus]